MECSGGYLTLETTPSKSQGCVYLPSLKLKNIANKKHILERAIVVKEKLRRLEQNILILLSLSSVKGWDLVPQTSSKVLSLSKGKETILKQPQKKTNQKLEQEASLDGEKLQTWQNDIIIVVTTDCKTITVNDKNCLAA